LNKRENKKFKLILLGLIITSLILLFYFVFSRSDKRIDRIVFVTIDTLRADHLGCFGYLLETSPFLDNLSGKGILFKNAFSATSTTTPSHASLFTSLHPLQHGVLNNGHRLAHEFLTLSEILQKRGFKTAGIVSTDRHFMAANINQGFEYFSEPSNLTVYKISQRTINKLKKEGIPKEILFKLKSAVDQVFLDESTFLSHLESQIGKKETKKYQESLLKQAELDLMYRGAKETIDTALTWLNSIDPAESFFLWIHLFDPHGPLRPPPDHLEKIESQTDDMLLLKFLEERHYISLSFLNKNKSHTLHQIKSYDAEIRYADFELSRFFNYYQQKGFDKRSLWVITADHGQGLGNHNWWKHGRNIYNEQIRVPLIFYFSSGNSQGITISQPVEHTDVLPTIVDIIGENANKLKNIEGSSLAPFFLKNSLARYKKKYIFSQRRIYEFSEICDVSSREKNGKSGEKYALQTDAFKYIHSTKELDEFFDLYKDPFELKNMVNSGTDIEEKLMKTLKAMIVRLKKYRSVKPLKVEKKVLKKLESLGYIN
jgi:arylsulfatase A-like enzyme